MEPSRFFYDTRLYFLEELSKNQTDLDEENLTLAEFQEGIYSLLERTIFSDKTDESKGENVDAYFKQFEEKRRLRLQLAPSFLQDLKWPTALDSLSLEEVIQYEFTSVFERVQKSVSLPAEASQLFISGLNSLSSCSLNKGEAIDHFSKRLKNYLKNSCCPDLLDRADLKASLRALKFFSTSNEISYMTIGEIRRVNLNEKFAESNRNASVDDIAWDVAKYSWGRFGCFVQNLLTVAKNGIKDIKVALNADYANKSFHSQGKKDKAFLKLSKAHSTEMKALSYIFKSIETMEMIFTSRGKIWMQCYETILSAIEIQQPHVREKVLKSLHELRHNLQLFQIQISKSEQMMKLSSKKFATVLAKDKIEAIQKRIQGRKHYLPAQFGDLNAKESVFIIKKAAKPKNLTEIVEYCYELLFDSQLDLEFCNHSIQNFLKQLEVFEKRFKLLKFPETSENFADQWFDFSEQKDQQDVVKHMQQHDSSDKAEKISEDQDSQQTEGHLLLKSSKENQLECQNPKREIKENSSSVVAKDLQKLSFSSPLKTKGNLFIEKFYRLPFFSSVFERLNSISSLSPKQLKIVHSTYRDVQLHLAILGSVMDLIHAAYQQKDGHKWLPYFARMMARSLSIVAEQEMTAELLACQYAYATLEHSHIELAKIIDQKSKQLLHSEDYAYLNQLNYGVVSHRYPHSFEFSLPPKKLPCVLKWLKHPQSIQLKDMQDLIKQTMRFLNRHQALTTDNLKELEEEIDTTFSFKRAEIKALKPSNRLEKADVLVLQMNQLLKSIKSLIDKQPIQQTPNVKNDKLDILLNIQYHFQGLNGGLECLSSFSDPSYLLGLGDNLLMHLQHLDELIEAYLYMETHQKGLRIHDLEIYRQLRGHQELEEKAQIVADLNCGYGDHYPHRYQVMAKLNKKTKAELPMAVKWRLDALEISLRTKVYEEGFLPVLSQSKHRQLESSDELRHYLIKVMTHMIELFANRLNEVKKEAIIS